jgi:type I restriction enzyme S subunit
MSDPVPNGWSACRFTDIFDIQGGTQPPKKVFKYQPEDGYIRLLQIRDFGLKPVPTFIPERLNLKRCATNDILIGRYGASVGRICTGMNGAYNVALAKVIIPADVDRRFVFWLLQSQFFQRPILDIERSAQNGFNKDDLAEIQIPICPKNEQTRIVAKLEKLLGKVDVCQNRLDQIPLLLKRFRQAVLAAACSGKLTADWRGGKDPDWTNLFVLDCLSEPLSNGRSVVNAVRGFPVLRLTCLKNGKIDLAERKIGAWTAQEAKRYLVKAGDFLVSRGNGSLRLVGKGGVVEEEPDAVAFPDTLIRLRLRKEMIADGFLALLWNSPLMREQIEAAAHTTAGIWKISQADIEGFTISLPSISEQIEIVRRVHHLLSVADQLEARYTKAKAHVDKLTQSILAKAFRGELVPQDPSDEPASVLLEKIQAQRSSEAKPNPRKRGK